ncbi:hypothetical protein GCM10007079_31060 [Nocardiopsis terrae]|nr:hypothetical protein GCM10007079_31060 [Nocardiopsis terrae]
MTVSPDLARPRATEALGALLDRSVAQIAEAAAETYDWPTIQRTADVWDNNTLPLFRAAVAPTAWAREQRARAGLDGRLRTGPAEMDGGPGPGERVHPGRPTAPATVAAQAAPHATAPTVGCEAARRHTGPRGLDDRPTAHRGRAADAVATRGHG